MLYGYIEINENKNSSRLLEFFNIIGKLCNFPIILNYIAQKIYFINFRAQTNLLKKSLIFSDLFFCILFIFINFCIFFKFFINKVINSTSREMTIFIFLACGNTSQNFDTFLNCRNCINMK